MSGPTKRRKAGERRPQLAIRLGPARHFDIRDVRSDGLAWAPVARGARPGRPILPFIGVYDAYSASLAVRQFDTLFLSGFSFSAGYYGLPDQGFIAWPDMVACAQRIRAVAPRAHLMVDMDDGYGDAGVATHAAAMLEVAGASGIVL